MNKKKLGTGLLALALVGVVGIGGSLAWFTDTEQATNEVSLSKVDINLTEPSWDGDVTGALPGDLFEKDPTITLAADSVNAWVRIAPLTVQVDFDNNGSVDEEIKLNTQDNLDLFKIELNDGWSLNTTDGYFYYNIALSARESTTALFDSITIPAGWGNAYVNAKITLDVQAEAIQYQNTSTTSCVEAFSLADNIADLEVTD